jgi:hypothetical protein
MGYKRIIARLVYDLAVIYIIVREDNDYQVDFVYTLSDKVFFRVVGSKLSYILDIITSYLVKYKIE